MSYPIPKVDYLHPTCSGVLPYDIFCHTWKFNPIPSCPFPVGVPVSEPSQPDQSLLRDTDSIPGAERTGFVTVPGLSACLCESFRGWEDGPEGEEC